MKEIILKKPLERGDGAPVTEIVLRPPNGAGELRGVSLIDIHRCEVDAVLTLTKRLTMTPLTPQELDRIDLHDLAELAAHFLSLFRD